MATKITELTEQTTPATGDVFPMVNDPAGTPTTKKITWSNVVTTMSSALSASASFLTSLASATQTFTNKTIDADLNTIVNIGTPEMASSAKSGSDPTVITGTAGTTDYVPKWNGDGDLVEGYEVLDEDDMNSNSNTKLSTQQAIKSYVDAKVNAIWIDSPDTWTYDTSTTFTVAGDKTSTFTKGTRIKLTNSSVKYFVVVNSSYLDPDTTVTVTGGDDYALTSGSITSPAFSYALNPPGYPTYFNWTPTWSSDGGAFTNDPASVNDGFKFMIAGNYCTIFMDFRYSATSGGSGVTLVTGLDIPPQTGFWSGYGAQLTSSAYNLYVDVDSSSSGTIRIAKYDGTTCIVNNARHAIGVTYRF